MQSQLKSALKELLDIMKEPFVAIKHAVQEIMKNIKVVLVKFRAVMIRMKKLIVKICERVYDNNIFLISTNFFFDKVSTIGKAFQFLGNVVSVCNRNVGTPFQRCVKMFEEANESCK